MTTTEFESQAGRVSVERSGQGPDLLLLHSLLSDRHAFDPVLPALEARWRVNRVDLPGFGESSLVPASLDSHADAVGGLLEAGSYDPDTCAVLGNGWGGFVALGTAIRHGGRFNKLVLVGCGTGFPDAAKAAFTGMISAVESGGMQAVMEAAVGRIFPPEYLSAHPEADHERRAVLARTDPAAFVSACRALIEVDYSNSLAWIANPTLVMVGSRDEATPPPLAREVAAGIARSSLLELEDLGHAPQLQDPPRFIRAVASFLGLPLEEGEAQ